MANTIQIKRSSTAAAVPLAGQLEPGELAVNLTDKLLYTKNNTDVVVSLTPVKAWVRFVGNTGVILDSSNVSSVTKVSTGIYDVTFTNAQPNANYGFSVSSGAGQTGVRATTTTVLRVQTENSSGAVVDSGFVFAAIFS
jgi:hypothetical protein